MENHANPRRRRVSRVETTYTDGWSRIDEAPVWQVTAGHYLLLFRYAARGLWWLLRAAVRHGPAILGTLVVMAGVLIAGLATAAAILVGMIAFPLLRAVISAWEPY